MNRNGLLIRVFFIGLLFMGNAVASPFDGAVENTSIAQLPIDNNVNKSADLQNNWLLDHVDKTVEKVKNVPIPAAILLFGPATLCLLGLSGRRK